MSDLEWKECKLSFENGEEAKATELIEFLSLFNKVYSIAMKMPTKLKDKIEINDYVISNLHDYTYPTIPDRIYALSHKKIKDISYEENNYLLDYFNEKYQFKIESISCNSPLNLKLNGIVYALVAAVIFSGGTVKTKGIEFELNSLAEAIVSINNAIKQSKSLEQNKEIEKDTTQNQSADDNNNPAI